MEVNVSMDLTVPQAFHILLQTLNVTLDDDPPKMEKLFATVMNEVNYIWHYII